MSNIKTLLSLLSEDLNTYVYVVDLDERGIFAVHVEDRNGFTVWEASTEEDENGEFWPVRDGFMKHVEDLAGLEAYLKQVKILPAKAELVSVFEESIDCNKGNAYILLQSIRESVSEEDALAELKNKAKELGYTVKARTVGFSDLARGSKKMVDIYKDGKHIIGSKSSFGPSKEHTEIAKLYNDYKNKIKNESLDEISFNMVQHYEQDPNYEKIVDDKTGSFVFVSKDPERITAVAFYPKATRNSAWHYKFKSEEDRKKYIDDWFVKQADRELSKQQWRAERTQKKTAEILNLKVGDVLVDSWGYDQTNIDFYQVVKTGQKSFVIRKIASKRAEDSGRGYDVAVMPDIDNFIGEPQVKTGFGTKFGYLHKWNGKPEYETAPGYGH